MDALNRSTTTRPLALAAMLLVAGVLFLRALSLFSAPVDTNPVGSPQEQRLTALIEPLVGPDRVRTSIQKEASGTTVWLILVDGPPVPEGMKSGYTEAILNLAQARGFSPERDRLDIIQHPFATAATADLSPLDLAELAGLGLTLLLLFTLCLQRAAPKPAEKTQTVAKPIPEIEPVQAPQNDNSIRRAAALANAAPESSAKLIQRWIKEDQP